jgi:prepilin-type N-terminal cleavage/methylation domain-containing protein
MSKLRRLALCERGYTLIELLMVTVILSVVMTGLTVLFVQATNAELQMNKRFQAQQEARVAIDKMRREIHCAKAITPAGNSASITVTIPSQCPTSGGSEINVVYDTQLVSAGRHRLRRAGVKIADYVRDADGVDDGVAKAFTYTAPTTDSLGRLRVDLPINIQPPGAGGTWELVADMVPRNTSRLP